MQLIPANYRNSKRTGASTGPVTRPRDEDRQTGGAAALSSGSWLLRVGVVHPINGAARAPFDPTESPPPPT